MTDEEALPDPDPPAPDGQDAPSPQAAGLEAFTRWITAKRRNGLLGKGTISGGLSVLDRLRRSYDLDIVTHTTPGGAQIRTSGPDVKRILEAHGETRRFASEGGRTNRGLLQEMKELLDALRSAGLEALSAEERNQALWDMQELLIDEVRAFFNQQRIEFAFDPTKSTSQLIREILEAAGPKRGAVAQHLVGAKLELRFPEVSITNESYSTADVQTGRSGDFQIRDAVFHVTVNPALDVYEKCKRNLAQGHKPYLLVVEDVELAAKQQAKISAAGKIAVASIEAFVSQNLDELSVFTNAESALQMLRLLQIYNRRVAEAETDKSLLIEIPANLQSLDTSDQP
jgi:hypothetical protein